MKNSSPGSPCTTIFSPSSNCTGSRASATVRRSHLSRDSARQQSGEWLYCSVLITSQPKPWRDSCERPRSWTLHTCLTQHGTCLLLILISVAPSGELHTALTPSPHCSTSQLNNCTQWQKWPMQSSLQVTDHCLSIPQITEGTYLIKSFIFGTT